MSDFDWSSVRGAVDIAIDRARAEIRSTVICALQDLGEVGKRAEAVILEQVQDIDAIVAFLQTLTDEPYRSRTPP